MEPKETPGRALVCAVNPDLRQVYAEKALAQIPRLLGNQDRNPFSPTYGCFHRDYWLDKVSDFPDAVRQFGVHALALVYKHDFPGNIFRGKPKVRDWAIAGLDFWAKIQHRDGSFDEFYPYERGWVGPTAFTTFTAIEAYNLLKEEIPPEIAQRVQRAILKAAHFIAAGECEEDHLANHHAMACLAVWKAFELTGDTELRKGFEDLWRGFLGYHNADEGWSREYDGVDPGYLSATVSFLSKVYKTNPDPEIFEVLKQSAEFCSYFAYPNGFYAGSAGSRNTLHFYPHGFEVIAGKVPIAAATAEAMLKGLSEGKLVPPEIMSDRYVFYRVPEFLQAWLDYGGRPSPLAPMPFERPPFASWFSESRIFVCNTARYYVLANLAKGGTLKVFQRTAAAGSRLRGKSELGPEPNGKLLLNDCGIIGCLEDGRLVTSQWIDPAYECSIVDGGWEVGGNLQAVPSTKLFTPAKQIVFRSVLVSLGIIPAFAHILKGRIRKALILGQRSVPIKFRRHMRFEGDAIRIDDELRIESNLKFKSLSIGDEFFVRYVPQSRYFQSQEIDIAGFAVEGEALSRLNREKNIRITTVLRQDRIERGYSS